VAAPPRRYLWIVAVALLVAALAAAGVLIVGTTRHGGGSETGEGSATSGGSAARGQVIFDTGHDAGGAVIPRSSNAAGSGMMGGGIGGGMMQASCSSCHGSDGHGRTTQTFTSPNITYPNLTDPKGMFAPDGSRGPVYSDAAIRTAVTTGVDPTGSHLAAPMPQWQPTDQQWADLLAYLKTLR
jgi:hypothetical protein